MIEFFNSAVRGDLAYDHYINEEARLSANAPPEQRPDAFEPEVIEYDAYIENLKNAGLDVGALESDGFLPDASTPAIAGNSDFMTGTVALTVFFVESDGSGSDPDLYTWTPEDMQHYLDGVATGLAWWASRAAMHGDCWVSFLINYYSGADPVTHQWVEPIQHSSDYQSTWINEIMTNLGYTSGGYFTKVTSFNTWQRSHYQTDRSYSAFVPYNPPPAGTSFKNGHTAYAYLGGPFTVLLFRVMGWTTGQVFSHESGHIFYACDEYAGGCGSYSCTSTCRNSSPNANCEACNVGSRDCMMKENSWSLCSYTPTHVGWEVNSPCSPPEPPLLPTPAVASINPPQGPHGLDMTVTVNGSDIYAGAKLEIGSGDVFVHTTELVGQSTLIANVTVLADAPPGIRDVKILNRDGQIATLTGAFEILATNRHYYSTTGNNNYPYITPADAATSMEDAIAATYGGDTLLMPTMTFDNFTLLVDRGVVLHGAWNNDFTQRDLQSGKTILNLVGNLTFFGASDIAGLDGFLIQNGTASFDFVPFSAWYGGAMRFLGGSAVLANCEVRSNSAGTAMDYGVGGAVYAQDCDVLISDNYFHTNFATQGGAVYLGNCSGTVTGNVISDNTVAGISETAHGGGLFALNCPNLAFSGNTFSANTGAEEGGGLYINNTAVLTMSGDSFNGNSASLAGGGVRIKNTNATLGGLDVSANSCDGIGGGVSAESPNVTLTGSILSSNSAAAGGALSVAGDDFAVNHNLFVRNDATGTGGAMILSGAGAGQVVGNTLDSNTSDGAGGILIGNSSVDISNNIVVNSTGTGLMCSGPAIPTLTYNVVWNNSDGDYDGCAPGVGSLSADPIFLNPAGGDYHLGLHSPAIDSGIPGAVFEDPDGSRGDMGIHGSHSFVMDQPSYPKNLAAEKNGGDVELSWDRNPELDVNNYAVYCDLTDDFTPVAANFVTLVPGADSTVIVTPPADTVYYRISVLDSDGYASGYSQAASASGDATAIDNPVVRHRFRLRQNVPNPFNPQTRISFELPSRVSVTLTVFDVDGRLVKTLVNGTKGPGTFTATWQGKNDNGEPVASGVYFYRLQAGRYVQTKKMVFLK
jgi:hypothetical protein